MLSLLPFRPRLGLASSLSMKAAALVVGTLVMLTSVQQITHGTAQRSMGMFVVPMDSETAAPPARATMPDAVIVVPFQEKPDGVVRVLNSAGEAIRGATVIVRNGPGAILAVLVSNDRGEVTFDPGSEPLRLIARAEGRGWSPEVTWKPKTPVPSLIIERAFVVRGVVRRRGEPVKGINVHVKTLLFNPPMVQGTISAPPPLTLTTDGDGAFERRIPCPQSTLLVGVQPDGGEHKIAKTEPGGMLVVELEAGGAVEIQGIVVANGKPVPNARVRFNAPQLSEHMGLADATLLTDTEGRFAIRCALKGAALLSARPPEPTTGATTTLGPSLPQMFRIEQTPHRVVLTLPEAIMVTGRVQRADGEPVSGAALDLEGDYLPREEYFALEEQWDDPEASTKMSSWRQSVCFNAISDDDGTFSLGPVPAGIPFRVRCRPDSRFSAGEQLQTDVDTESPLVFVIPRFGEHPNDIEVTILDPESRAPLANSRISATTDALNFFSPRSAGVPDQERPGVHQLWARDFKGDVLLDLYAIDRPPLRIPLPRLAGPSPHRLTLELPKGHSIRVEVVNEDGTPAANIPLRVKGPGRPTAYDSVPYTGKTDAEGHYTSPLLRRGRAKVTLPRHDIERLARTIPGANTLKIVLQGR